MKKTTLRQGLFNKARAVKNWARHYGAMVGLWAASAGLVAGIVHVNNVQKTAAARQDAILAHHNAIWELWAAHQGAGSIPLAKDADALQQIADHARQMALTPAQSEKMSRDYNLPRTLFAENQTVDQGLAQ